MIALLANVASFMTEFSCSEIKTGYRHLDATGDSCCRSPQSNQSLSITDMLSQKAMSSVSPGRTMWIGNSYTYWGNFGMTSMHHDMIYSALSSEERATYGIGGSYGSTIPGAWIMDHGDMLTTRNLWTNMGTVMLQPNSYEWTSNPDVLVHFERAVSAVHKMGAKPMFYISPAKGVSHSTYIPGNYDMLEGIDAVFLNLSKALKVPMVPAHIAFSKVYKEHVDCEICDNIFVHDLDGTHPSPEGMFLAGATAFFTTYCHHDVESTLDAYDLRMNTSSSYRGWRNGDGRAQQKLIKEKEAELFTRETRFLLFKYAKEAVTEWMMKEGSVSGCVPPP
jgi:hypothetical protein